MTKSKTNLFRDYAFPEGRIIILFEGKQYLCLYNPTLGIVENAITGAQFYDSEGLGVISFIDSYLKDR